MDRERVCGFRGGGIYGHNRRWSASAVNVKKDEIKEVEEEDYM